MNTIFKLTSSDWAKGAVMAVLGGVFLPLLAAIQTPDFSVLTVDWRAVVILAINGGLVGLASYITKNFFSTSDGRVLGKIG
jgi:hypothetical protein